MTVSKTQNIEKTKANLPLPDQPPQASDWQSADGRNVNVRAGSSENAAASEIAGSGKAGVSAASSAGLREPATQASENVDMSSIGRQGKDGLNTVPADAVTREKKAQVEKRGE